VPNLSKLHSILDNTLKINSIRKLQKVDYSHFGISYLNWEISAATSVQCCGAASLPSAELISTSSMLRRASLGQPFWGFGHGDLGTILALPKSLGQPCPSFGL
jgi:hypothetical protein